MIIVATNEVRRWLAAAVARAAGITVAQVDPTQPFDAYGIDSAEAVSLSGELEEWLGRELPPSLLYEHPTIARLAAFLTAAPLDGADEPPPIAPGLADDPICVIGMDCRFPGGSGDPERYWTNLVRGQDGASAVPALRWDADALFDEDPDAPRGIYTTVGGFIDDVDGFDAAFFGISPREALRMDPHQRLVLEVGWQALANAGVSGRELRGSRTGVFVGMMAGNQYAAVQIAAGGDDVLDDPYFGMGSAASVLAGRISYLLDLRGPSMTIDTACSSSLVAVHQAVESLRSGSSDLALAGGVSAILHPDTMRQACRLRMLAADGRCKTFDAAADGFRMGEGCGVVVLARRSTAAERGYRVLAELRGSAVNSDGASNGLTAPNGAAQSAVIRQALATAGLVPAQVDYVEAHGTGTSLGDVIEMSALHDVFGPGRTADRPLVVGAVKTNIGHLTGAAGVAGLIKAVLAVGHGVVPPNLHLSARNPGIDWDRCPTLLPDRPWTWDRPDGERIAGISSFGWAGTNAHIIVSSPAPVPARGSAPDGPHLILLSARSAETLGQSATRLATRIRADHRTALADLAHSTQVGDLGMEHRASVVCADRQDAVPALHRVAEQPPVRRTDPTGSTAVSFLLPGSGEQYPGMGSTLHATEPVFAEIVDACAAQVAEPLGVDLRELLIAPRPTPAGGGGLRVLLGRQSTDEGGSAAARQLQRMDVAHAAVFVMDYACARTWMHWGVQPAALLGYSLGEYAAACLAGVFDVADALALVVARAQLVMRAPAGCMLTVAAPADRMAGMLVPGVHVAAINSPRTCVVAGTEDGIARFENRLDAADIAHRRIASTRAMHTRLLDPVRAGLAELLARMTLRPPAIPYQSNVTGTWITDEQAVDPGYWAEHLCRPVRFESGVVDMVRRNGGVLLETGPGQLASLALQTLAAHPDLPAGAFGSIPSPTDPVGGRYAWLRTAGALWGAGVPVDWTRSHPSGSVRRTALPGYPFQHTSFWPQGPRPGAAPPVVRPTGKENDPDRWTYVPTWRRAAGPPAPAAPQNTRWLLLDSAAGVLGEVADVLRAGGGDVVVVAPGEIDAGEIDAGEIDAGETDWTALLRGLAADGKLPHRVVHGLVVGPVPDAPLADRLAAAQERGLCSVAHLLQALDTVAPDAPVTLITLSSGVHAVTGDEPLAPERSTLLAAARTVPQEFPAVRCRHVDIAVPAAGPTPAQVSALATELRAEHDEPSTALRGGHRWVPELVRVPLPAPTAALPLSAPPGRAWRQSGVYLITGGAGELGTAVATALRERFDARLVLLSRTALPPQAEWAGLRASLPADDPVLTRIETALRLDPDGTRVLRVAADVTDAAAVAAAVDAAVARFGTLHGVIHAAGVPGGGLLRFRTDEQIMRVLAPKLAGTVAVRAAVADRELDLFVAFSSAVVEIGGLGEYDYSAANCFLDALAVAGGTPELTTVDWGPWQRDSWQASALADVPQLRDTLTELRARHGITDAEGVDMLGRAVASGLPRVLVLPQDLPTFTAAWQELTTITAIGGPAADAPRFPRPQLRTTYVAPRTDVERAVALAWGEQLGMDGVGIDDVFFELGGNSLIGTTIMNRLRRELGTTLVPAALFEAPTVRTLSALITDGAAPADQLGTAADRGGRRRRGASAAAARRVRAGSGRS